MPVIKKLMNIREINRFSQKVYNEVLKLMPQLDISSTLPSPLHFKRILKDSNTHFFVCELENKKIVGMITICTCNIPSGTKVWIEDVVIDESQRGKGFGKELILFAVSYARSLGAKAVDLTSRPSRVAANLLYQKIGFTLRETNVYRYLLE
jgi:ribosomal protein S18 acetylase RimI-like enzyme